MLRRNEFLFAAGAASAGAAVAAGRPALAADDLRAQLHPGQRIVAIAVSSAAQVIDFAGPWEVFADTLLPPHDYKNVAEKDLAFRVYHVGDETTVVTATGDMQVVPRYTFANAPRPDIVVVGAQIGSPALTSWLKAQQPTAEVIMAVCTGVFHLAKAGLLAGKSVTTHHFSYDRFEKAYPAVKLIRGPRFVDDGQICSSGGLSSGIDLALHIVERLHGKTAADRTAEYMEFVRSPRPVYDDRAPA
jgi:transcriptional regulator GlxA family with amidase domain